MVPKCGWPSLSQWTSRPWTFSTAETQDISTPCLHILSPGYGDEPMSSPVTATSGILSQEWQGISHYYMPCCLPLLFMTPITHTSCGLPNPEWSWQPFYVTRSSCVAVLHYLVIVSCTCVLCAVLAACCYGLPLYHSSLHHHIISINCDQLTTNFCCSLIPCIQKLNYHLDLMLRTPFQSSRPV